MKIYSGQLTGSTTVSTLVVTEKISTTGNASIDLSTISGSVAIEASGSTTPYFFLVRKQGKEYFKVNTEGVTVLGLLDSTPTPAAGGMYFDNSGSFYVGL